MHANFDHGQSIKYEADYKENNRLKTLTINVSHKLQHSLSAEKIKKIIPALLEQISEPTTRDRLVVNIVDYNPHKHVLKYQHGNKEGSFSEFASSTVKVSEIQLKSHAEKKLNEDDFGALGGGITLSELVPELSHKKMDPPNSLKAIATMLNKHHHTLFAIKELKDLSEQAKNAANDAEELSLVINDDDNLKSFLNKKMVESTTKTVTIPFGYHREGLFIPLFINLRREGDVTHIQTVAIDPAMDRKVPSYNAYQRTDLDDKQLYNMLRALAQIAREIPQQSEKKEASKADILNAAIEIGAGGKSNTLREAKEKLQTLDQDISSNRDPAKLKNLMEQREKTLETILALERPQLPWTSHAQDISLLIDALITSTGATKLQPGPLVAASHDRFKIVSNWLLATSKDPGLLKQHLNDVEADITMKLIQSELSGVDQIKSISEKLDRVALLEKLIHRYEKHSKKAIRNDQLAQKESALMFGNFKNTIKELKRTLIQKSHQELNATFEAPKWSYTFNTGKTHPTTALKRVSESAILQLAPQRQAIVDALRNQSASALATAFENYATACKTYFDDFDYPEVIKAVNSALELLPVPLRGSDFSEFWRNEPLQTIENFSKALTTLTQYAWEAQLKTGRAGCYPSEIINLLNTRAILNQLIHSAANSPVNQNQKALQVYKEFNCDYEQALSILTKQAFLRFARSPELESKAMQLRRYYIDIRDEGKMTLMLDSFRHMWKSQENDERTFLTKIAEANGIMNLQEQAKWDYWRRSWRENWSREQPHLHLPKLGVDLRRHALFSQCMLHPDWVMVKGFQSGVFSSFDKINWLANELSKAANETGETDSDVLVKYISKKELANIKEQLLNMGHLELIPGEDSEKGFLNQPVINFKDSSNTNPYQISYHPRGFMTVDMRNPYHDAPMIGQAGKVPEQFLSTRTSHADIPLDNTKRQREMETVKPTTELTVLQEEQLSPATNLPEIHNAQLRSLTVDSPNGPLVSPLTFLNVFNYILANPDQLENENIQHILEEALLQPGLIQSMLNPYLELMEINQISQPLRDAISYACQQGRVKSALFLMHIGSLIKAHGQINRDAYNNFDRRLSHPTHDLNRLNHFLSDVSSLNTSYMIKDSQKTGLEYVDQLINSGDLDAATKKYVSTYVLDYYYKEHKQQYTPTDFVRILQSYAFIKNTWGDIGDIVLQREGMEWVEKAVIPAFQQLPDAEKYRILSSISAKRMTAIPAKESVPWRFENNQYKSEHGKIVNIEGGYVQTNASEEITFECDLPDDILLNSTYKSLFGDKAQPAKRILTQTSSAITYEFQRGETQFKVSYYPRTSQIEIYQIASEGNRRITYRYLSLQKSHKQPANVIERNGIWQDVHNSSQGVVVLSNDIHVSKVNVLKVKLEGQSPDWRIVDCRDHQDRKVLFDTSHRLKQLLPFADPSDLLIVLNDIKEKNEIAEIHILSKKIKLVKQDGVWKGSDDYKSYQWVSSPEKIKEAQDILGENHHLFAIPMEKIVVSTIRGKAKDHIVRKRQNMAFVMPVKLHKEGTVSAVSSSNTDPHIKPLQLLYETEEVLKDTFTSTSRSRLKGTTTGFLYMAYAAFVDGDYDRAAKFLVDSNENPFLPEEADALDKIIDYIREHQDSSIRGAAFKLKVELAARKIESDRKGIKSFRPATWEQYLKKVHSDIALYQHYKSRVEHPELAEAKKAVIGPALELTAEETLEYEQLIKESLQVLLLNVKKQPIWEKRIRHWEPREIPPEVFDGFSHDLADAMQPNNPRDPSFLLEHLPSSIPAAIFLKNFWTYANEIRDKKILENDWRINLLKNLDLTNASDHERKNIEVGRQLLITFAKGNSLAPELIRTLKFQLPSNLHKEYFTSVIRKALGWDTNEELAKILREEMAPYLKFHQTLNPPQSQTQVETEAKQSEQFQTSVAKLTSVLNDKKQNTFSVEELNFWKKAVETLDKDPDKVVDLLDLLRKAALGQQLNLTAKRHETEVMRAIRTQEKSVQPARNTVVSNPKLSSHEGDHPFRNVIEEYQNIIRDNFVPEAWQPPSYQVHKEIITIFDGNHASDVSIFSSIYESIRSSEKPEFLDSLLVSMRSGAPGLPMTIRWHLGQAAKIRLSELKRGQKATSLPKFEPQKIPEPIANEPLHQAMQENQLEKDRFTTTYQSIIDARDVEKLREIAAKIDIGPLTDPLMKAIYIRVKEIESKKDRSELPQNANLLSLIFSLDKAFERSSSQDEYIRRLAEIHQANLKKVLEPKENKRAFDLLYLRIFNSLSEQEIENVLNDKASEPFYSILSKFAAYRITEIKAKLTIDSTPKLRELSPKQFKGILDQLTKDNLKETEIRLMQGQEKAYRLSYKTSLARKNVQARTLEEIFNDHELKYLYLKTYAEVRKAKSTKAVNDILQNEAFPDPSILPEIAIVASYRLVEISNPDSKLPDYSAYIYTPEISEIDQNLQDNLEKLTRAERASYQDKHAELNFKDPKKWNIFSLLVTDLKRANTVEEVQQLLQVPDAVNLMDYLAPLAAIREIEIKHNNGASIIPEAQTFANEATPQNLHAFIDKVKDDFTKVQQLSEHQRAFTFLHKQKEDYETVKNFKKTIYSFVQQPEIMQVYNEIVNAQSIEKLLEVIFTNRWNIFKKGTVLVNAAAMKYQDLKNNAAQSTLSNTDRYDRNRLDGPKPQPKSLAQILMYRNVFEFFNHIDTGATAVEIERHCAEIEAKGLEIIKEMYTSHSSPMEEAENRLVRMAIQDEIEAKQNDARNDMGVLPKNPTQLEALKQKLSTLAQISITNQERRRQEFFDTLRAYPEISPNLQVMLNRPDIYSDEEIFEKALDLYKSHELIREIPNNPPVTAKAYFAEVALTKLLYDATELTQINKALTTLKEMESLVTADYNTLEEQETWNVEWKEKSKTLYGYIQSAGNKSRYLDVSLIRLKDPELSRRHLVAEYRNEMIARPSQPTTVEKMVNDNNVVILLKPGAGKSKWITPEVAQLLAQQKNKLPIILVTDEMFHINSRDLDQDTRKMFKQARHIFEFNRNTPKDPAYLADEYKRISDVKKNGGYIVTTIARLAALDDEIVSTYNDLVAAHTKFRQTYSKDNQSSHLNDPAFIQQLRTVTDLKKQLMGLQKLHSIMRKDAAYVSDEVDDIFNINRDYNYSITPAQGQAMRKPDAIVTAVMDQVMRTVMGSKNNVTLAQLATIIQNNQQATLARKFINADGEEESRLKPYLEAIAASIYDEKQPFGLKESQWAAITAQATKDQFVRFIVTGQKGFPIAWDPADETLKHLAALKRILIITFSDAMALKADVDYGLDIDGYTVVPKKEGVSIPNIRYGDEYELITMQFLYHASKAPSQDYFTEQWRKEEDLLESGDPIARKVWGAWKTEAHVENKSARDKQKLLYDRYAAKESWEQRLTLLRKDILENKIQLFAEQIKCNSQDPLGGDVTNTGASGTVDEYALPDTFHRDASVMSRQVMADTLIKLAMMKKEHGINHPVTVFTDVMDLIQQQAQNLKCKYIIDQGAATEGKKTKEMVDFIRSKAPTRQILYVTTVQENGKEIRKQMMLNPGGKPEPFDRARLDKNCLVYFGPPDIRGTDWPIPPGTGDLILGATTLDEQFLQAIWRARKLGEGQEVQLYIHESVAKSIKSDAKVTFANLLNEIKRRTLDARANLHLKAAFHKIKGITLQEVKKELFVPTIADEEEYWGIDLTKQRLSLSDSKKAFKILIDIETDCKKFTAARGLFIEKREINFESDYQPLEMKDVRELFQERFQAEMDRADSLELLGKQVVDRIKKAIENSVKKFIAEFESRHKINLKPQNPSTAGSSGSQEQVQAQQQQQQQQQMVSLVATTTTPKHPIPNKTTNSWLNWIERANLYNIWVHFDIPARDNTDPVKFGHSIERIAPNCGFSPNLMLTENYRRLWHEMKLHDGELFGRVAVIQNGNEARFVLIDQLDFDRGFLAAINNVSEFYKQNNNISVFSLDSKSARSFRFNASTGPLNLSKEGLKAHFNHLVQIKVLAGSLNFQSQDQQDALERWMTSLTKEQKDNLRQLYCKMRRVDNVGQIYGWANSHLAKYLI